MMEPRRKVPLGEMSDACYFEAVRLRGSQEALVRTGQRSEPDAEIARRIEAFDAAHWILKTISNNEASFRDWLASLRKPAS